MLKQIICSILWISFAVSLTGCGAGSAEISTNDNGAKLMSLSVSPTDPAIAKNPGQQLTATGIYSDNTTRDVTAYVIWNSSDTTVASVGNNPDSSQVNAFQSAMATPSIDNPGHAYAKAVGKATITATAGGTSASTTLTVTPATLASISITPTNPSIAKGTAQQFTATGTFSDNTTQDMTATVTWSSSNAGVSTIGGSGLAASTGTGSATITAASGSISGSTTLTITPAVLVSLAVTPTNPSIAKGTTQQFTATGTFSDNTTQNLTTAALWSSSDASIADISNAAGSHGLATAAAVGSATITSAAGGVSGSSTLTVTPATLGSISITPANPSIAKGTKQQFNATGSYTDGSTQNLTATVVWSSSNTTVATIGNAAGSYGLATSLATGPTTITAASGTVSGTATLTVTAATLVSITVTPANPSIAKGTKQQFIATGTYSDNSTQNLTTTITWSSSSTAVATISNAAGSQGLATSAATGATTITATSGGISGSTYLTITPAILTSIVITPVNPSVAQGATQQFTATGTYSDGSTQNLTTAVTWSASNTAVATISNAAGSKGLASAVAVGTTSITAISGSVSTTSTLTVTAITTGSATLSWDVPTTNTDGTPLTNLAGYKIYYGTSSGNYTKIIDVGNVTTYVINNLAPGTYYFTTSAYDTSGIESGYSNEVSKTLF